MSNKVAPPESGVDALGASEAGVQSLKSYFTMFAPLVLWFYVIPFMTAQIFEHPTEWVEKPGTQPEMPVIEKIEESSDTFDPLAEEAAVAEPVEL